MDRLANRVAIVTGAGRGIGREYALGLAAHGASVVVNDLGAADEESGLTPAESVAAEIVAAGGHAIADASDITDWDAAHRLVDKAVEEFGTVDVLINNAGILRDRMLVNMTPEEWDDVIRVHLRGHFCPTQAVAGLWRTQTKLNPGAPLPDRVLIHTSSISGLFGSPGQSNYATAKSGIATFAYECHLELNERLGVRSYAVAPSARTRLTSNSPASAELVKKPEDGFDFFDPANLSPFVVWLSSETSSAPSGSVFTIEGDEVALVTPWTKEQPVSNGSRRWSLDELDAAVPLIFDAAATR